MYTKGAPPHPDPFSTQHGYFVSDDIRQEIQRRAQDIWAPNLSLLSQPEEVHVYHTIMQLGDFTGDRKKTFGNWTSIGYRATSSLDGNVYALRRIESDYVLLVLLSTIFNLSQITGSHVRTLLPTWNLGHISTIQILYESKKHLPLWHLEIAVSLLSCASIYLDVSCPQLLSLPMSTILSPLRCSTRISNLNWIFIQASRSLQIPFQRLCYGRMPFKYLMQ